VIGTMVITIIMMYWIDKHIQEMMKQRSAASKPVEVVTN